MRGFYLHSSAHRLSHAMKALKERWDMTEAEWDDQVRRQFEEEFLKPLENQVRGTLGGIDKLAEVLSRAQKDCS